MKLEKTFNFLFILLVPSIIVSFAANAVLLVTLSVISIYQLKGNYTKDFFAKYRLFLAFLASILIGLFIDFVLNKEFDISQVTKRASFILMPFIIYYAKEHIQILSLKIYVYFLSSLSFMLILLGLIRSVLNRDKILYGNWDSKTTEAFYEQDLFINWGELSYKKIFFILDMHPSYYALFSCIAIILLLFTRLFDIKNIWKWALLILHALMIILVSSKAGLISLFLILTVAFFSVKQIKQKFIAASVIAVIIVIVMSIPSTQLRIKKSYDTLALNNKELKTNKTDDRITLWKSLEIFSAKELILGTGYHSSVSKIRLHTGIDKNLHNQFLQTLVSSGIIGLSLLIIFLVAPLLYDKSLFTKVFFGLIVLNLLFENMLDRIWGIIFISFFYALFIFGEINFSLNKAKEIAD
jgi:hypothetical protein